MIAAIRKHRVRIAIGLCVVLVFLAHATGPLGFRLPLAEALEAIVYDARLRLTMPGTVDSRIVILDIDEKSLAERENGGEGRWPWPRDRLALLVEKLFDHYGVAIVGFDVVFAERDESSGVRVLERLSEQELREVPQFRSALAKIRPQLDYDEIFARGIRGRPVVLGYTFSADTPGFTIKKGVLPRPLFPKGTFTARPIDAQKFVGYTGNLKLLQDSAAGAGHFNSRTDEDGIVRRVPMLAEFEGAYYEPLSLAMVRVLRNMPPVKAIVPDEKFAPRSYPGLEWLQMGDVRIPVDDEACALVPYRGRKGSFNYFSVVDVMNERVDRAALQGKIVLVGTTAPGLLDLRATPVEPVYPGVEIHANMIAGMLDGSIKQRPPYVVGAEFMLLLVSGLSMAVLLPLLNPRGSTLTTLAMLVAVLGTNVAVFQYGHLVLPLASGILLILLLFTFNMAYGYFVEARGARQIAGLFGQYVPPELVEKMAENPEQFNMTPRAQELTVLFSDVRGFTGISESLAPDELSAYINEYLTVMSLVIREQHHGTLDKYVGDAIMAFWGAPVPDSLHARNAVLAALAMQDAAKALNEKFRAKGWPTFKIGIGVNSGVMRVGDMGSKIRRAYTVMGDAVNVASRLEGITKEYGADIIVGEATRNLLSGLVLRELDRVRVKGKGDPVVVYELFGVEERLAQAKLSEIALWNQVLKHYRRQQWDMAELQLLNLRKIAPACELYELFLSRASRFRANPPGEQWDGVWTFDTK